MYNIKTVFEKNPNLYLLMLNLSLLLNFKKNL